MQWHSDIYLMLSHASEPSVLMSPTERGWSLLHLQYAGRMRLANIEPLQQIVEQRLGVYATVLRCVTAHTAHQQLAAIFWKTIAAHGVRRWGGAGRHARL